VLRSLRLLLAPSVVIAPFAGVIVDRSSRKQLMMLSDTVVGLSTFAILLLYLIGNLQIWHLYLIAAINGVCNQMQVLAYGVSIPMLVPKQQYTRAVSMGSILSYGSEIVGPALGAVQYSLVRSYPPTPHERDGTPKSCWYLA